MWGGIECTVNRVHNEYFDQTERTGHDHRIGDLDLFAGLGIKALRYPVVWERVAPGDLKKADWSWTDVRLGRLRELGIKPIAGLLHHGSGPRHTNLLDDKFPEKLAAYAGAVARRYPWVEMYTPVNEPLTTARFSCLYGHWFPHHCNPLSFMRALLNECKGTALAMRAIREINPDAKLVQTEDLGKTYSTELLAYQADFENERRWLTFDLLCGRVTPDHPMWHHLLWVGIDQRNLEWFVDNPCPPDVMGINYYLTSERFLDHRLDHYPEHLHGGNGGHAYADVEAVRVLPGGIAGVQPLIREAWERFNLPVAITEVHNGCTREQQMVWLAEIWSAAVNLKTNGVDIRGVTPWALLGSYDWHTLVTRVEGKYEPGIFDLRGRTQEPRHTALASMVRKIASGVELSHPALSSEGWWHRPSRLIYNVDCRDLERTSTVNQKRRKAKVQVHPRPILITGSTGTLGSAFARLCDARGLHYISLKRLDLDIANDAQIVEVLKQYKPWAVVNAAGYVRVDDAEREREACFRENTVGPASLAKACAEQCIRLLTFSSDLVFDGTKGAAYVESDTISPLNVYGESKAEAERLVLDAHPGALVVRTSAFFGPWDEFNFVTIALKSLEHAGNFSASGGEIVSPTYVPDLVDTCLDLLIDGETGMWHLANQGALSWVDFARLAAAMAGLDPSLVTPAMGEYSSPARRPIFSALTSERTLLLPTLEDALARYLRDCTVLRRKERGGTMESEREMVAAS